MGAPPNITRRRLLLAPRTYYRLFEPYNLDLWPLQLLALGATLLVLWRRGGARDAPAISPWPSSARRRCCEALEVTPHAVSRRRLYPAAGIFVSRLARSRGARLRSLSQLRRITLHIGEPGRRRWQSPRCCASRC